MENPPDYPYPVDSNDHCESPIEAYNDISAILERFASEAYKTKESLRIYDPYFCEGSVIERLNNLGFMTVYNVKEDFYEKISTNTIPEYDVLVTNPPYSEDHMEKLINFCFQSNKPWFLLLPNYVYTKIYFSAALGNGSYLASQVFYVTPLSRYLYSTPKVSQYCILKSLYLIDCWYCIYRDVAKLKAASLHPHFLHFGTAIS